MFPEFDEIGKRTAAARNSKSHCTDGIDKTQFLQKFSYRKSHYRNSRLASGNDALEMIKTSLIGDKRVGIQKSSIWRNGWLPSSVELIKPRYCVENVVQSTRRCTGITGHAQTEDY